MKTVLTMLLALLFTTLIPMDAEAGHGGGRRGSRSKTVSTTRPKTSRPTTSQPTHSPAVRPATVSTSAVETYNGHKVYVGPRGGRYYLSSTGSKVYIK